jgi:hypothetical protein
MARRVFISYQHKDQLKAKGFNLMRYNEYLDLEFVGRHLLDPVKSDNRLFAVLSGLLSVRTCRRAWGW